MTDRGIPEQIKTGFNMLVPEEDPTENIASIVLVFMENAIKSVHETSNISLALIIIFYCVSGR